MCDGLAGTCPYTSPTCAAAACGVQEHLGAATNEKPDAGSTQEGGGSRRSAVTGEEENAKEQHGNEEERDGGTTDRDEDEEVTAGQRRAEIGVWLLPNRGEEEDEAADGGLNTAAILGGGAQNPATLLEKRGIARCVGTPDCGKGGREE
ncbi:hypothetical protein NDU88_006032 [Pleurodeles waltl]|uniref:Uncharacterized protein n=1 Tax=Pleurodeles waltl TaxID=8319 RepID=A0AAV7L988_PLEWA|nr:hypothetical protein NDU88_006032 [Pleurodeles waltl]